MFGKLEALENKYVELEKQLADPDVLQRSGDIPQTAKAHADLRGCGGALPAAPPPRAGDSRQQGPPPRQRSRYQGRWPRRRSPRPRRSCPSWSSSSRSCCCPRIRWMKRIPSLRSGPGPAAKRLRSLRPIFSACIRAMRKSKAGKVEVMSESPSDSGGYKEIICLISGDRVYSHLKFEAGTHRVQRVPATETPGPHPYVRRYGGRHARS